MALVIQEGIKAGKVGCTVQMADGVFCGVVRKWGLQPRSSLPSSDNLVHKRVS